MIGYKNRTTSRSFQNSIVAVSTSLGAIFDKVKPFQANFKHKIKYVPKSKSESSSFEQKGGWWQEESKIVCEMARNRMWWYRKKEGFEGVGV